MISIFIRRETPGNCLHRVKAMGMDREETTICKVRKEASWGPNPLMPWSWTCSPRTVRNKCLVFISHLIYDILLQQPQLIHTPKFKLLIYKTGEPGKQLKCVLQNQVIDISYKGLNGGVHNSAILACKSSNGPAWHQVLLLQVSAWKPKVWGTGPRSEGPVLNPGPGITMPCKCLEGEINSVLLKVSQLPNSRTFGLF